MCLLWILAYKRSSNGAVLQTREDKSKIMEKWFPVRQHIKACIPPQYFNSDPRSDSQAPLWAHLVSELQPNLSFSLQPSSSHKTWPLLNTSNKRIIPTAPAERSAFTATCACLTQNPSFQRGLINTSTALIHTIHTHTHKGVPTPHLWPIPSNYRPSFR